MITSETDADALYILQAIDLSRTAVKEGNYPFGSLLVLDGKIVLETVNTVMKTKDVTRHAELNLVSEASKVHSPSELQRATLYTSCEPCAMCSGSIYFAGIGRVVYSCRSEVFAKIVGDPFAVPCKDIVQSGGHEVIVAGPLFEESSSKILEDYFRKE